MAKITIDGILYEGTADELKELFEMMGVEFPEVKAEEPLKVGDYAKVTKYGDRGVKDGDLVRVTETERKSNSGFTIRAERLDGKYEDVFSPDQLIVATDKEVAEAKVEEERKAKAKKWAKIVRKPNEFKKGDIVRITRYQNGPKVGTLVEIAVAHTNSANLIGGYAANFDAIELITPVEARFGHE